MQCGRAAADLVPAAGREARVGRHQRDGVIAPVIREAGRHQVQFIDRCGAGHDLDSRHAQFYEVIDGGGMSETGESAADCLGHARMRFGEAPDMQLVNDRVRPWAPARRPGFGGYRPDRYRFRHGRRAIGCIEAQIFLRSVEPIAEHCRRQRERAIQRQGVRIYEKFRRIEPVSIAGRIWPVRAKAVALPRAHSLEMTVEDIACAAGQAHPLHLGLPRSVEKTDLDNRCMGGKDCNIGATLIKCNAKRLRGAFAYAAVHAAVSIVTFSGTSSR